MGNLTAATRELLLADAMIRMQTGGWNEFSFRDLAVAHGIKSSSVHYHFATKQDLVRALLADYRTKVLAVLDGPGEPGQRVGAFVDLFRETARTGERFCLAGMMASDLTSLAPELRGDLAMFFQVVEDKLAMLLGEIAGSGRESGKAVLLLSALEGALLLHRTSTEKDLLRRTIDTLSGLMGLPDTDSAFRRDEPTKT